MERGVRIDSPLPLPFQFPKATDFFKKLFFFVVYLFGYTLSWTSLVAQLVKNMPSMQEIRVQFLG